jgi:hypothetical protein
MHDCGGMPTDRALSGEKLSVHEVARAAIEASGFRPAQSPSRVPVPALRGTGSLSLDERWASLLWSIDTAEQFGSDSLRGLTIALSRLIQAEALELLLFDARPRNEPPLLPSDVLWDSDLPLTSSGATMDQLTLLSEQAITVNLEDAAVFPRIWERWRLHRALGRIGPGRVDGPYAQSGNHFGVRWHPWPLVWLENGNHSTLAAQLRGGGDFECHASFDFTPVLDAVRTDGANWYRVDDGTVVGPVTSVPMAGIFVVGQRLARLARKQNF